MAHKLITPAEISAKSDILEVRYALSEGLRDPQDLTFVANVANMFAPVFSVAVCREVAPEVVEHSEHLLRYIGEENVSSYQNLWFCNLSQLKGHAGPLFCRPELADARVNGGPSVLSVHLLPTYLTAEQSRLAVGHLNLFVSWLFGNAPLTPVLNVAAFFGKLQWTYLMSEKFGLKSAPFMMYHPTAYKTAILGTQRKAA